MKTSHLGRAFACLAIAIAGMLLSAGIALAAPTVPYDKTECLLCHDQATGSGATTRVNFKATAGPSGVDYGTCYSCHWVGMNNYVLGTSFKHSHNSPRGCKGCHAGSMLYQDPSRTPINSFAEGWFHSDPRSKSPAQIHAIHNSGSWVKDGGMDPNVCGSCHQSTACSMCHTGIDPAKHANHTNGSATYPPVSVYVAGGAPVTTWPYFSQHAEQSACVNASCHDMTDPAAVAFISPDCVACHSVGAPGVPSHPADLDVRHDSVTDFIACAVCHTKAIAIEHPLHTDADGVAYGCITCHSTTVRQQVRDAITRMDNRCEACHTLGAAAHATQHTSSVSTTPDPASGGVCADCHAANLMDEHLKTRSSSAPKGCAACHPAPRGDMVGSWDRTCVTGPCHAPATAQEMHGNIVAAHTASAPTAASCARNCHSRDLRTEHAKAGKGRVPVTCKACHMTKVNSMLAPWDGTCTACHAGPHYTGAKAGDGDCLECHGTTGVSGMSTVGTAGAFANTGGDHSGVAASAHGAVPGGNNGGISTGITCEACHSHVSADTTRNVDYRTSGLAAASTSQADLCYRCHSASAAETRTAGAKPYSWNGRDVKAEFARTSHHPVVAAVETRREETVTVFEQSTQAAFSLDTLTKVSNVDSEGPTLAYGDNMTSPLPDQRMMFFLDHNTRFQQFDLTRQVWNDDGYDPPDPSPGGEPYAVATAGNRVFVWGKSGAWPFNQELDMFSPPNLSSPGIWTILGTFGSGNYTGSTYPQGADIAYDELHDRLYMLRGQASSDLYVWDIATGTRSTYDIRTVGGVSMPQDAGAALAYSPQMDAVYLLNGDPATTQGQLYRIDQPELASGVATANSVIQASKWDNPGNGQMNYRMTRVTIDGKDHLYVMGTCIEHNAASMMLISNLDTTPTRGTSHQWPYAAGWGNAAGSNDLEFDGQGRVYITNEAAGINPSALKVAVVPTGTPTAGLSWANVNPPTSLAGGYMGFVTATPPPHLAPGYPVTGRLVTPDIDAPSDLVRWGRVSYAVDMPSYTSAVFGVDGWNGTSWDHLAVTPATSSTIDISGIDAAAYRRVRLVADLSTADNSVTPRILSWSATGVRRRVGSPNELQHVQSVDYIQSKPGIVSYDSTTQSFGPAKGTSTQVWLSQADRPLVLVLQGISGRVDQYDPATNQWNAWNWDPTDLDASLVSGTTSSFIASGTPYFSFVRDTGSPTFDARLRYEPKRLGSLSLNFSNAGQSSMSYFDRTTLGGGSAVDASRGMAFTIGNTTGGQPARAALRTWSGANYSVAGTLTILGESWSGARELAYAPAQDRLWFTTDTRLDWIPTPAAGGTPWGVFGYTGFKKSTDWAHMTRFTVGGADYLMVVSSQSTTAVARVASALWNGVPTITTISPSPFPGQNTWGGGSVAWDGGSYIYATQGTGSSLWSRIAIPADPVAGPWGIWQPLPVPPGGAFQSCGVVAPVTGSNLQQSTPGFVNETQYYEVLPRPQDRGWVSAVASWSVPASGTQFVWLQGWNGASWVNLGAAYAPNVTYGLSQYSTAAYPKMRLCVTFNPGNPATQLRLDSWSIMSGWGVSTRVSDPVVPSSTSDHWLSAIWDVSIPVGGDASATVQGWNGSQWMDIPGYTGRTETAIDLSGLSTAEWPQLRLVAHQFSAGPLNDPQVLNWWVLSSYDRESPRTALTCVSCHGPHSVASGGSGAWDTARVSDPANTKSPFGGTPTEFCLTCHSGADAPRSRFETTTVVPYTVQSGSNAAPYFTGLDKTAPRTGYAGSAHATSAIGRTGCENCHDPHGSDNAALAAWTLPVWFTGGSAGVRDNSAAAASEEKLCYQCHGNATVGRTAPGAPDVASPASQSYAHPVSATGRHSDTESVIALGAANRHAECVDCHDAHAAASGVHAEGSSNPGGALRGATGVRPVYSGTAASSAVRYETVMISGRATGREAYLCFKCHTSATTLPASGGSNGLGATDLAREFNPANPSYHDILGTGRGVLTSYVVGGSTIDWPWTGTMANGWTTNSKMTCTDCHTGGSAGQARGPHGSTAKFLLDPAYAGDWEAAGIDFTKAYGMSQNIICEKCHTLTDRSDSVHGADYLVSNVHTVERGSSIRCITCHVRTPHGWKRPRLLGYTTDPAPYRSTGLVGVKVRGRTSGWFTTDCAASCTSFGDHGNTGGYWP